MAAMAPLPPPALSYQPCHNHTSEGLVSERALRIIVETKACFVALALALAYFLTASQHRLWSSSHLIKGFLFAVTQPVTRFLFGMFTMLLSMPFRNDLYLLWGILLLAGYEGVYTISGYGVSARRSDLAVHEFTRAYNIVTLALYVRYYSHASQFRCPLWALWALMVAKFLERIVRFKVANGRYGDASTSFVADYMKHEHKIEKTSFKSKDDEEDLCLNDCNYLIVGDAEAEAERVESQYEPQYRPADDTVTVAKVWSCKEELLTSEKNGEELRDACLSFALCKLLKRKFAGVATADSERSKAQRLVFDDLVGSGWRRTFRVVRTELGFARDMLYTKYPILFSSGFPVVSTALFVVTVGVSVWITVSAVRRYRVPQGSSSNLVHGKNVDLVITFAIVGMVTGMEICEFFIHLFSDWAKSNPCAICLGGMAAGGGQAIFTAECSHTFHFPCISASVAHGNLVCPLCNARWRELPSVLPAAQPAPVPRARPLPRGEPIHHVQPLPTRHVPLHGWQPQHQPEEPQVFDDDEQIDPPSDVAASSSRSGGTLAVTTHTEFSAVARDSSHDNFAVLVHLKAPGMMMTDGEATSGDAPRAPLDLVTVLDVSGSMTGSKLALLKQAMGFVIDNLGPHDRLSVVSFSNGARRVTRLLRMSDTGKATAKSAVESLVARGGTNIAEGLRTAARVLDERRHRNTVSSVILLSDGQDTYTAPRWSRGGAPPNYEALVPPSFMATTGTSRDWSAPVHTFGFGNDHDAAAMNVIAEATAGTFSYIENQAVIQDAFAQCIGGLLTVVVQEARLAIASLHPGVCIGSVKSGRYESRVDEDGRSASVRVGELYADEERRFLLFLTVPAVEATDGETALIKVSCSYRDTAGGAHVDVTAEDAVVARPEQVVDSERSTEVERERVRVEATEDIAAARAAAERGAHQEAVEILESRQRAVAQSEAAVGGDLTIQALGAELQEMRRLVSNQNYYAQSGRAFLLSGLSSHLHQRATMNMMNMAGPMNIAGRMNMAEEASSFATPAMRAMLLRSRNARKESSVDQQPPPSKAGKEAESSAPESVV